MPKRNPIAIQTLIDATVESAKGLSIRQVQAKFDVSDRAARHIASAAGLSREQYMSGVQSNLMSALGQASERLSTEMDKLSTSQLAVVTGILSDKVGNTQANQAGPTTQVNIQINGQTADKAKVIGKLFGNAETVSVTTGPGTKPINVSDSVDTSVIDLPTEPKEIDGQ